MRVTNLVTHVVDAGWRNYVFVRVQTDEGLEGTGEATIEWVPTVVAEAIEMFGDRYVVGRDPFDIEDITFHMQRDEFVRTEPILLSAMGGIEIALWDIVGQALGEPIWRLLGGLVNPKMRAYANAWYKGEATPESFAVQAAEVVSAGYTAMKFDPLGTAAREIDRQSLIRACDLVGAVRDAAGPDIDLLIEVHGRLSPPQALEFAREIEQYRPYLIEEPIEPENFDALVPLAAKLTTRLATGERCFGVYQTVELLQRNVVDILQTDLIHSGGILQTKKIAAIADAFYVPIAPHNPYGPVGEMACLHVDASSPNFLIQETVADYDVPWRADLVLGNPAVVDGEFTAPTEPGLGVRLNLDAVAEHPYSADQTMNLWESAWQSFDIAN